MKCPHCNQEHPDNAKFCMETGKPLLKACINKDCLDFEKYILPSEAKFCPRCGEELMEKSPSSMHMVEDMGDVWTIPVNGEAIKMIRVKAGSFEMGDYEELDAPTHDVEITHDYYMGETVVTNGLICAILTYNNGEFAQELEEELPDNWENDYYEGHENEPLICMNWYSAKKIIRILRKITGAKFDLPTEAEWEYAARGGHKSEGYLYSGSDDIDEVAWYEENTDDAIPDVKMMEPNEIGLYDMSGLVSEWCSDWYDSDYYDKSPLKNPKGPRTGDRKVLRGGSYADDASSCTSSYRFYTDPDSDSSWVDKGFRLVVRMQ